MWSRWNKDSGPITQKAIILIGDAGFERLDAAIGHLGLPMQEARGVSGLFQFHSKVLDS